uniref:Uncharacterized protein n=1 Tax=Nelumbo nucifera TaxID=4432 RepID=A0A822XC58_NELNU|nr:TPA_asm: hypothetical protein HUJ06_020457 [Nelumbo nucifera]
MDFSRIAINNPYQCHRRHITYVHGVGVSCLQQKPICINDLHNRTCQISHIDN